jgi:hypothetical protein
MKFWKLAKQSPRNSNLSKKTILAPSDFYVDIERAPGSSQLQHQPVHACVVSFGLKTKMTKLTKMTKMTKKSLMTPKTYFWILNILCHFRPIYAICTQFVCHFTPSAL